MEKEEREKGRGRGERGKEEGRSVANFFFFLGEISPTDPLAMVADFGLSAKMFGDSMRVEKGKGKIRKI